MTKTSISKRKSRDRAHFTFSLKIIKMENTRRKGILQRLDNIKKRF